MPISGNSYAGSAHRFQTRPRIAVASSSGSKRAPPTGFGAFRTTITSRTAYSTTPALRPTRFSSWLMIDAPPSHYAPDEPRRSANPTSGCRAFIDGRTVRVSGRFHGSIICAPTHCRSWRVCGRGYAVRAVLVVPCAVTCYRYLHADRSASIHGCAPHSRSPRWAWAPPRRRSRRNSAARARFREPSRIRRAPGWPPSRSTSAIRSAGSNAAPRPTRRGSSSSATFRRTGITCR